MTKTDVHVMYQKESGKSLTTIQGIVTGRWVIVDCPDCNSTNDTKTDLDEDIAEYIEFLENKLCELL